MRVLVTGATGFVGRRLLGRLDDCVVLSRDAERARRSLAGFHVRAFSWDAQAELPPAEAFEGVEAVIHLAGEPVAEGRWTAAKKARMRDSRVLGTRNLVERITKLTDKPRVLISASAVGFYGSRRDEELDEKASPGDDFLADICRNWESESHAARSAGIRVVNPRIGIVLGAGGGALSQMLLPFRLGLGAPLGGGRQWMPWIHLDDLVSILLFAAERPEIDGPVNATAPNPLTNREFTRELARALGRPAIFPPVPGFMLRLLKGQFAQVLLSSQRTVPSVLQKAGFQFQYSQLSDALRAILDNKST